MMLLFALLATSVALAEAPEAPNLTNARAIWAFTDPLRGSLDSLTTGAPIHEAFGFEVGIARSADWLKRELDGRTLTDEPYLVMLAFEVVVDEQAVDTLVWLGIAGTGPPETLLLEAAGEPSPRPAGVMSLTGRPPNTAELKRGLASLAAVLSGPQCAAIPFVPEGDKRLPDRMTDREQARTKLTQACAGLAAREGATLVPTLGSMMTPLTSTPGAPKVWLSIMWTPNAEEWSVTINGPMPL